MVEGQDPVTGDAAQHRAVALGLSLFVLKAQDLANRHVDHRIHRGFGEVQFATIDDPDILEEIAEALATVGYPQL